ncbi:CheY-like superfamily [Pelagophyceae sp. CCMP2097]|nr:CheY-like superfamily [Pelagophyceae sp. CCMP2097]
MGSALSTLPERVDSGTVKDRIDLDILRAAISKYDGEKELSPDEVADLYNALSTKLKERPVQPAPPAPGTLVHLLVVDDSPLALTQASSMFHAAVKDSGTNFQINTAISGEKALATLRQMQESGGATRHVVLLDLVMPGISGLDVLMMIRQDERLAPVTSVNVFTGVDDQASCLDCLRLGAEHVLFKPFTMRKALQLCTDLGLETNPRLKLRPRPTPTRSAVADGPGDGKAQSPSEERRDREQRRSVVLSRSGAGPDPAAPAPAPVSPVPAVRLPAVARPAPAGDVAQASRAAWTAPLYRKDATQTTLQEEVGGRPSVLLFFSGAAAAVGDEAQSDSALVGRAMLRELNYYAAALEKQGVAVCAICCEPRAALAALSDDLGLSFPILGDVNLVVAAAYVGVCADGGPPAPRAGVAVVSADRDLIARDIVASGATLGESAYAPRAAFAAAELAFATVKRASAKGVATIASVVPLRAHAAAYAASHGAPANRDGRVAPAPPPAAGGDRPTMPPLAALLARAGLHDVEAQALKLALTNLGARFSPKTPRQEQKRAAGKCVLVVEDSTMSADLMIRKILRIGHYAMYAADGRDALKLLRSCGDTIDLIISDVLMPQMDGVELLSRIKTDNNLKHLPVALLTGMTDREDLNHICADLGGYKVLQKPLSIETLVDVVETMCSEEQ